MPHGFRRFAFPAALHVERMYCRRRRGDFVGPSDVSDHPENACASRMYLLIIRSSPLTLVIGQTRSVKHEFVLNRCRQIAACGFAAELQRALGCFNGL